MARWSSSLPAMEAAVGSISMREWRDSWVGRVPEEVMKVMGCSIWGKGWARWQLGVRPTSGGANGGGRRWECGIGPVGAIYRPG